MQDAEASAVGNILKEDAVGINEADAESKDGSTKGGLFRVDAQQEHSCQSGLNRDDERCRYAEPSGTVLQEQVRKFTSAPSFSQGGDEKNDPNKQLGYDG